MILCAQGGTAWSKATRCDWRPLYVDEGHLIWWKLTCYQWWSQQTFIFYVTVVIGYVLWLKYIYINVILGFPIYFNICQLNDLQISLAYRMCYVITIYIKPFLRKCFNIITFKSFLFITFYLELRLMRICMILWVIICNIH